MEVGTIFWGDYAQKSHAWNVPERGDHLWDFTVLMLDKTFTRKKNDSDFHSKSMITPLSPESPQDIVLNWLLVYECFIYPYHMIHLKMFYFQTPLTKTKKLISDHGISFNNMVSSTVAGAYMCEYFQEWNGQVPSRPQNYVTISTQWVHVSTTVNKAGWVLVDGSRIHQPDLVTFVGQLSGSCTAANVSL